MKSKSVIQTDVLVIGSGLAGATVALQLADKGIDVLLITCSTDVKESNTRYAQGGIIYKGEGDPDLLVEDDYKASNGTCYKKR